MNKSQRCLLHFRCIARKSLHGQDCAWHWQHVWRELGLGIYRARGDSSTHNHA